MHFERPTFKTIGIGRTFRKTIFLGLLGTFLVNEQLQIALASFLLN